MNISMNSATVSPAAVADTATPNPAGAAALPQDAAGLPAQAPVPAPAERPFQQWLGLDPAMLAAEAALVAEQPLDAAAPEAEAEAALDSETAVAAEPLLAAMSMNVPLMPAALPAMMMAMPAAVRAAPTAPAAEQASGEAPAALPAGGAIELPEAIAALPLAAADSPALQVARQAAPVQPQSAQSAQPGASQFAAPAPAPAPAEAMASASADTLGAGFGVNAQAPVTAAAKGGDTVTLAGPPTAWRQTLQEALGDRLQLASSKNVDQAVIRLEPPNLGRIDISIRHAAGSLEVNISATHGEVLRQLNTVSENLRNDLAQRQYGEVSVNVTQATRAQAGAQPGAQFGSDAQGRGRQQGQEQERTPGMALFEAGKPDSLFSLNGRE
jgi:flagellar hook-length control protein FliK